MSPPRGEEPHQKGSCKKSWSQKKVEGVYYSIGLFCNTYPVIVLIIFFAVFLVCCLPLVHLPFPGSFPQQTWASSLNITNEQQKPYCYVQQVVMRVAVLPWLEELTLGDAFRAPLYEVFKLLDIIRNYQDQNSSKTLGHVCLHVEAISKSKLNKDSILPQYSCLVLSPANFWHQNVNEFAQDNSILTTIFNNQNFQKGKTSDAEILFGMRLYDTGIKRYPLRSRQRVIQYAVTLFLKEFDSEFLEGFKTKLSSTYRLHQNDSKHFSNDSENIVVLRYPGEIKYQELVPVIFSFCMLLLYYYFYVRKIDIVKSKFGVALAATSAVCFSLLMTLGICFFFGLTLNFHGGKEIFPYLAMLVGLENVLVLTRSVATTSEHLDVKIRFAQALSKEGWAITKNILVEITILTFGLFTFVPLIQKLCIFSIVGLITDLFSQIFYFLIIFGMDVARKVNYSEKTSQNFRPHLYQTPWIYERSLRGISRSKSHPKLSNIHTNVVANQQHSAQDKKVPKRLRIVNIWTRTRFFQRSFMILMVSWIGMIIYNSDIMNSYILNILEEKTEKHTTSNVNQNYPSINLYSILNTNNSMHVNYVTYNNAQIMDNGKSDNVDLDKLKHPEYDPWMKLSTRHWEIILRKYNISVGDRVVVVLPSIKLSHVVSPDEAKLLRNPNEHYGEKFQWQALAAALDPLDFTADNEALADKRLQSEQPFYPSSPMEILLTTILCIISVIVLAYMFVVLYRCICSRNYAEWRASWFPEKGEDSDQSQVFLEALPVALEGHDQELECIATDGLNLASVCLGGVLKFWDNSTGELVATIDRKEYFQQKKFEEYLDDEVPSDYESGSPPSRDSVFPKLVNRINPNFSSVRNFALDQLETKSKFDKSYRYYYHDLGHDSKHKWDIQWLDIETRKRRSLTETTSKKSSETEVPCTNDSKMYDFSPIWCIDFVDNLIVAGCADGRLELWEGTTGTLKYVFHDENRSGINNVKIVGSKAIVTRLCGTLEFFLLQNYNQGRPVNWNFSCSYRRTHVRTGSVGSVVKTEAVQVADEDLRCSKILSVKAHQQQITCLDCEGDKILTGSQDHTLRVFRLDNGSPLYTLHGHYGTITCLFIDRVCPSTSGSGSQDGMLCVWDLLSGACMYSVQAHDGSVLSLTYSASYVISLGSDERLCVWERFQGHLLNTIFVGQIFSYQVLMLTPHLVVTAKSGGLVIWDVRMGECVRTIALGRSPFVMIKHLILLRDAVLCDYGNQLRIIRFPLITHKFD